MAVEVDFVVKLGGSTITNKDILETVNEEALNAAADVLAQCFHFGLQFIVAHGAGSFGHQWAKQYDVVHGYKSKNTGEEQAKVKLGFAVTQQSVHKLNRLVVESLVYRGIPALGISPCPLWTKHDGHVTSDGCCELEKLVIEGFVPVIHGDAILDTDTGCCILSADTILEVVCAKLSVKRAVFVMDCNGIYTCPPELPEARLVPELHVNADGSMSDDAVVTTSTTVVDSTGGIAHKMKSAVSIVHASAGRVELLLCSLSGNAFRDACMHGHWRADDSVGTVISLQQ